MTLKELILKLCAIGEAHGDLEIIIANGKRVINVRSSGDSDKRVILTTEPYKYFANDTHI